MICTSKIPCLSSGLPKNNKLIFMFVLLFWLFGHFDNLAFFENLEPKHSNRMLSVNFSKIK